jgi:hypothetical protein
MSRSNFVSGGGAAAEGILTTKASGEAQIASSNASTQMGIEMDQNATENSAAKQMSLAARTAQEANATNSKGASDMMKSGAG